MNPGVGGEGITIKALTEVLHHVVTLRLTVNVDIKVKLLLDLDNILDLLLDELLVLLSGDLTLGKLVTLDTDLLGLGEGTNSSGWEERKTKGLLLSSDTGRELRKSVVHLFGDLRLTLLDLRVVGAGGGSTGLHGLGVSLKLLTDGSWALSDSLGNDSDLRSLLDSEGEPVSDLWVELLLAGKSVWGVEKGAGSGNNDTLLSELLDGSLNGLDSTLEVGLPDVSAVDNTCGEDSLWAESRDDGAQLLWISDQVNVNSVDVLGDGLDVVDDITEVGGEDKLWDLVTESSELLVGWLESSLGLSWEILDEGWLINLDSLSTGSLQLSEELLVDWEELLKEVDWVNSLVTVSLSELEERDWADEDWAGDDTSLLGLEELNNSLWVGSELELLVVL